jgi:cyanophycinase-like exopeptidase
VLLDETRRNYHISRGFGVDENTALVVTHAGSEAMKGKVVYASFSRYIFREHIYFI